MSDSKEKVLELIIPNPFYQKSFENNFQPLKIEQCGGIEQLDSVWKLSPAKRYSLSSGDLSESQKDLLVTWITSYHVTLL